MDVVPAGTRCRPTHPDRPGGDGFDPGIGTPFLSYAATTVRGETKRRFRDRDWMIRPPRRIQELQARITIANSELSQSLGRSPRPSESPPISAIWSAPRTTHLQVSRLLTRIMADLRAGLEDSRDAAV